MDGELAERGRLVNELIAMFAEGVPTDDLIRKIVEWGERDTPDRYLFLGEQLQVIYENVLEGSKIPENIIDDDGTYRQMRESDTIVRASIERMRGEIQHRLNAE